MASNGYMRINGERQGLISAGCNSQPSIGNRCQLSHQDEILVLALNHAMSNTDNTRRATHHPVSITKLVDKASPLLAQAVDSQEALVCEIDLYRTHSGGHQEKYFSIKLEGAVIVAQELDIPHAVLMADQQAQEQLLIRYRSIRWSHHAAGTTGHAAWGKIP
ncbi:MULTISPECIES: Hcp family type VI secretion system effector [Pseudomonas]|uniref:Hcp family type VI secretion system effector n=1 Tax=Pseudomonas TaxID=286 RepID=UPI00224A713F|nr:MULTISPECIES: Hcp family type VI secretion system effector [unclassified Pseudomonas]MCX2888384.1 Hcp family type VI secretion system effector [Pseudomonas sp. DCB_BI]MDH4549304.1 Hcp family type VI secretion system effector [Pseudomonas sp. BN607]